MTKRTLIFVGYGLLTAFLALAPLGASLFYSRTATIDAAEQRTSLLAQEIAGRASQILLSAEAVLADLAFDARRGCWTGFVDELRNAAVLVGHITSVAYVDPKGEVGCTSFGMTNGEPPFVSVELLRPRGAVVAFTRPVATSHAPGVYVTAIYALKGGASLHVLIDPQAFLDRFDLDGLSEQGRVEVTLMDSILVSHGPPLDLDRRYISMVKDVGVYDAGVSIAVPRAWALRDWLDEALIYGVLGLIASGILVAGAIVLLKRRYSLTGRLQQAIRNQELEVHYQPLIDIEAGRCVGTEALVRWRDPERGLLRPDLFIALAEETGLILPITDWLVRRVVNEMKPLLADDPDLHVAINLAPQHFRSSRLANEIVAAFRNAGLSPNQVVFEVTERGLIDDPAARDVIGELRRHHVGIALDDFGTGYSNLAYLQDFKIDYLKIDQRFISPIDSGAPTADLAAMIIEIARSLDLTIIAEGIETKDQVSYLKAKGVRLVQGWYFTQPLPAEAFRAFLTEFNAGRTG